MAEVDRGRDDVIRMAREAIEAERWKAYKAGTPEQGRGQPFVEGQSDGAEQCAAAIRERRET